MIASDNLLIAGESDKPASRFVPPFGEYPHVGGDLSVLLTVAELVTERTRLDRTVDGRNFNLMVAIQVLSLL